MVKVETEAPASRRKPSATATPSTLDKRTSPRLYNRIRFRVRRAKALRFSGCESRPATCSFQPVAIGAGHGGNDMD